MKPLSLKRLITNMRDDFKSGNQDAILLFAHNGVGKTRLSMAFKDYIDKKSKSNKTNEQTLDYKHTLYFNAYTEDLFYWDNDLVNNTEIVLKINKKSQFFAGLQELALEEKIEKYLSQYCNFNFKIDYENWQVNFYKDQNDNIKISRGEEHIFIFCMFLAIMQLALDGDDAYKWVKYIYIDDPISSLDENNAIAIAHDLAQILKIYLNLAQNLQDKIKFIISSHHSLFFNVIYNELKKHESSTYFLTKSSESEGRFKLHKTDETPFFYHLVMLGELRLAVQNNNLYTYHFNILRSILEKTARFLGLDHFSNCLDFCEDKNLYARALNLLSHGQYAIYEPREMVLDNKILFSKVLKEFLDHYEFKLPELYITKEDNNETSQTQKQQ